MPVTTLDHLVITVTDREATRRFYVDGLGMSFVSFTDAAGAERDALAFGSQKINVHYVTRTFEPKALHPTPGSADLCFLVDEPLDVIAQRMTRLGFPLLEGPVPRTGATGPLTSLYYRDADGNLIELSRPA